MILNFKNSERNIGQKLKKKANFNLPELILTKQKYNYIQLYKISSHFFNKLIIQLLCMTNKN